ncbi:MAG TPA: prepilin-type N-terminal cleavage/methylation domain-containing protein [Candidatus Acidoferrales bacterium]|jgi:general secretion pathway protein G|nr:prepilin-type N-terminal cleavage/methylation domain-containing protein [Candidatus Acidoferrales bacterium]
MKLSQHKSSRRWRESIQRGFTLIELMIVMAIILVLATIASVHYRNAVLRSREAVLKTDLKVMNDAINYYTRDKEAAPQSLDDLVSGQYLGAIPDDPMTSTKDWVTVNCDTLMDPDQTTTGICSVHSASDKVSPFENTPYSTW